MLEFTYYNTEKIDNVIPVRADRKFERKNHKCTQMVNRMNKKQAL